MITGAVKNGLGTTAEMNGGRDTAAPTIGRPSRERRPLVVGIAEELPLDRVTAVACDAPLV
jgi:hypothetical protein